MSKKTLAAILAALCVPVLFLFGLPALVVVTLISQGGAAAANASASGIPLQLQLAYEQAASAMAEQCPGLRWSILAGIGQVESGQAQGRQISSSGDVSPPIIGPRLDGSGAGGNTTPIYDTDQGVLDGDTKFDRAVGALQFLPTTWASLGQDGNNDGDKDPQNVYDVALAAASHLCGTSSDLRDQDGLRRALHAYNHSDIYVRDVMGWIQTYDALVGSATTVEIPAEASERARRVIQVASRWLGTPYSWGGGGAQGPSRGIEHGADTVGFDCSGLTQYAYAAVGIQLPRVSSDQYNVPGLRLPAQAGAAPLQPGDLVFFGHRPAGVSRGSGNGVTHVGIYVGGGKMLNAPRTGTVVRVETLWLDTYLGAVRLP